MKNKPLSNEELREMMEFTIRDLYEKVQAETESGKAANLANSMTNMISRYKEMYQVIEVDPTRMRSAKGF